MRLPAEAALAVIGATNAEKPTDHSMVRVATATVSARFPMRKE